MDEILLDDFGGWDLGGVYPPAPKPAPKPTPHGGRRDHHDLTVKITGAATVEAVAIPFAKVASATMVAGAGPNDCGHVSVVASGTGTAVVIRGAAKGPTQTVRLGVLA